MYQKRREEKEGEKVNKRKVDVAHKQSKTQRRTREKHIDYQEIKKKFK